MVRCGMLAMERSTERVSGMAMMMDSCNAIGVAASSFSSSSFMAGQQIMRWCSKAWMGSCSRSRCSRSATILMRRAPLKMRAAAQEEPLDLTPENVEKALIDARSEIFDTSVGITGVAELADLDGPFLKLRLQGRFWHERSVVLARLTNYLQRRIPEIVEVQIEDESQLDDSTANFGHG